MSNFFVLNI